MIWVEDRGGTKTGYCFVMVTETKWDGRKTLASQWKEMAKFKHKDHTSVKTGKDSRCSRTSVCQRI